MKTRGYIALALLCFWSSAAYGAQQGGSAAATGAGTAEKGSVTQSTEETETARPPKIEVGKMQVQTEVSNVVLEPQPLPETNEEGVTESDAAQRNPFSEVIVTEKIPDKEYLTVAEQCRLRGIIKLGGQQMVLLQLPGDSDKGGGTKEGKGEKLRRYALGDRIMIIEGPQEFHFTLKALDNRSAVLRGENNEEYMLWL